MGKVFNLVKNCEEQEISWLACDWLVTTATHERPDEEHMLEVQMTQVSKASHDLVATWPTCDWLAKGH